MAPAVPGKNANRNEIAKENENRAIMQAELLRQDGNACFKKGRLNAAIEFYTQAITICPTVPIIWTNRALCHRKRNDWEKVESDCKKALELDPNSVKAHYMLGLALLERKQNVDGIKHLEKALQLGRGVNPSSSSYIVEDIWKELAKAKYLHWEFSATLALGKQRELRFFCERALEKYDDSQSARPTMNLDIGSENECEQPMEVDVSMKESGSVRYPEDSDSDSENVLKRWKKILADVFDKAAQDDTPTEVPEYLTCCITLEIFRDPVIAPSGITYERAAVLEHLRKIGSFDPVTREALHPEQLVPNLAIKEAVQAFLNKHGWAYKVI